MGNIVLITLFIFANSLLSAGGFVVTRRVERPELQATLTEGYHEDSGAHIIHIHTPDPENFFSLAFRTHPTSSNGIAHVLEHSCLEGSQAFPVPGAFHHMTHRSMNTFMNAVTIPDATYYLASSEIQEDFYNLLDIYLDAVFHPLLTSLALAQEGHRLEFAIPDDPTSGLEHRGVVYNEMKGKQGIGRLLLEINLQKALFPNSTYEYRSGGNIEEIPNITHEELLQFHQKHYFPGNCLFFFYGNIPIETHMAFLEEKGIFNIEKRALPVEPKQPRFTESISREVSYATTDESNGCLIGISWLTSESANHRDTLGLILLDQILMGTDSAPLKRELAASGLCQQSYTSLDADLSEMPFSFCFQGCKPEDAERLEAIIREALTRYQQEGIPNELIERTLDHYELANSYFPTAVGSSLFQRCGPRILHGEDAALCLDIQTCLQDFRQTLKDTPRHFQELIDTYFLKNQHKVRLVLNPSAALAQEEQLQEQKALKQPLSEEETANIIAISEAIKKRSSEANVELLPKISLNQVPKAFKSPQFTTHHQGSLPIYHFEGNNQNVTLVDLVFDLPEVAESDIWLLQLYATLAPSSSLEREVRILEHTGGILTQLTCNPQAEDPDFVTPSIHFRGISLNRKSAELFSLLHETALLSDFQDKAHLKSLIFKHYNDLQNNFLLNAHRIAMYTSLSFTHCVHRFLNQWHGLEYLNKVKALTESFDEQIDQIIEKFREIERGLTRPTLLVTCSEIAFESLKKGDFGDLVNIRVKNYFPSWQSTCTLKEIAPQRLPCVSPVAFNAIGFKIGPMSQPESASIALAARLFNAKVLHERIRVQGGAYGGAANYDVPQGIFSFMSYRDPHIDSTVQAFREAIDTIARGDFTEEDLEEAKIQQLQILDYPLTSQDAYLNLVTGRNGYLQLFRDKLFSTSREEVQKAVKDYIAPAFDERMLVTIAGRELT